MDRQLPVAHLLSLTLASLLAGCGDNDAKPQPETPTQLTVRAIDGYLKGALVWLDVDGNYALSAGEPNAITDGSGNAVLEVAEVDNPGQYRVLVQAIAGQTTDVGDGTATPKPVTRTFTLSAPAGITTVTPLTTLVEQTMRSNPTMSREQASAQVAEQLGLEADAADGLLEDFIAQQDTTHQVYALNIVAVLPESLTEQADDSLLQQGAAVGQALDDYLAQHPLDDSIQPDDIRVVVDETGQVKEVIQDSDGDSVADAQDAFPQDPTEWLDSDGDKVGDNADAFPQDPLKAAAAQIESLDQVDSEIDSHLDRRVAFRKTGTITTQAYLDGSRHVSQDLTYLYWDKENAEVITLAGKPLVYKRLQVEEQIDPQGHYVSTASWQHDLNRDGQLGGQGANLEIGQLTATSRDGWRYLDEGDLSDDLPGAAINPTRIFDGVDLQAALTEGNMQVFDHIQHIHSDFDEAGSSTTRISGYRNGASEAAFDPAQPGSEQYRITDTVQLTADGGKTVSQRRNWLVNGSLNPDSNGDITLQVAADGSEVLTVNKPIYPNPQNEEFEEYADYNWNGPSNEMSPYWVEYSETFRRQDGRWHSDSQGRRYLLNWNGEAPTQTKWVDETHPDGVVFSEWHAVRQQVSDTEVTESSRWQHYHLDGYDFTTANDTMGQHYLINQRDDQGFWIGHRFAEWGSQAVTDLADKVEQLRGQGLALSEITADNLPGLSDYNGTLLSDSFRFDETGAARTWYWVSRLPVLTGDNSWSTWTKVKLQLVDGGLDEAGYADWIIRQTNGAIMLLAPMTEDPSNWYTAYQRYALTLWKPSGDYVDTSKGVIHNWLGTFYLNEQDADAAILQHEMDIDGDGVLNEEDAFPYDASESRDSDQDGMGDNSDAFPNDPTEWTDSDQDGVGNNADVYPQDPTRSEMNNLPVAEFLPLNGNLYMLGQNGDSSLWLDNWERWNDGRYGWLNSYVLNAPDSYDIDNSMNYQYREILTEQGWQYVFDNEPLQLVLNADGSVTNETLANPGLLTGSCNSLKNQPLSAVFDQLSAAPSVMNDQLVYPAGAYGCRVTFTPQAETLSIANSNEYETRYTGNGQVYGLAYDVAELFVSQAPGAEVISQPDSFPIWLWWDAPSTYYRLVLIGDPLSEDSGRTQVWSADGQSLLLETEQGWRKTSLGGQTLIRLDGAIAELTGNEDAGFVQGPSGLVQRLESSGVAPQPLVFLNQQAYDSLMSGRQYQATNNQG
ncbi:MAG: hypothetical protein LRY38_09730 [Aeromonadaceae bacterium]|nr:hypothetical protein [Aeromonadaceae bacterium]